MIGKAVFSLIFITLPKIIFDDYQSQSLYRRLPVRENSQQTVNRKMQKHINDNGDDNRQCQRKSVF